MSRRLAVSSPFARPCRGGGAWRVGVGTAFALVGCRDATGPSRVANIRPQAARVIVVEGAGAPLDTLFDITTVASRRLTGSGAARFSVTGAGWRVRGDTVYAPTTGESRATVVAEADGARATIEAVSVFDLARRRWRVVAFCDCPQPNCWSTLASRGDSTLVEATVDVVHRPPFALYTPGPFDTPGLESVWQIGEVRYEEYVSRRTTESAWVPAGLSSSSRAGAIVPGEFAFRQYAPDTVSGAPLTRRPVLRYQPATAYLRRGIPGTCEARLDRPTFIEER